MCLLTLASFHAGTYSFFLLNSHNEIYSSFWAEFKCISSVKLFSSSLAEKNLSLSRALFPLYSILFTSLLHFVVPLCWRPYLANVSVPEWLVQH